MKTLKNLFQKLISKDHIREVVLKSIKGKKYASKVTPKIDMIVNTTYAISSAKLTN